MVFCSFTFLLLFMPLVLLVHRALPEKAKRPFLFAASLLFYGWGNPVWLLLLFWVMGLERLRLGVWAMTKIDQP